MSGALIQRYSKCTSVPPSARAPACGALADASGLVCRVAPRRFVGASASTTSMSTTSDTPSRGCAPGHVPDAGRRSRVVQSCIRWSVNGSWLTITSRNAKHLVDGLGNGDGDGDGAGKTYGTCQMDQLVHHRPTRTPDRAVAFSMPRSIARPSADLGDLSLRASPRSWHQPPDAQPSLRIEGRALGWPSSRWAAPASGPRPSSPAIDDDTDPRA